MLKTNIFISLLLMLTLLLSACSPAPTPDPKIQYTIVASTVQARLTEAAQSAPPRTPTPPLPEKNSTPMPVIPVATITLPPTLALPTTAVPVATLAATQPPVMGTPNDKAAWVSNTPADGSIVAPWTKFTTTWTVKNTGPTTWNTKYSLRYFAGWRFEASNITFPKEVKPGESVDLVVAMTAPPDNGNYNSIWALTNDQGQNFYSVNLALIVGTGSATTTVTLTPGATGTVTLAATAARTPTPTPTYDGPPITLTPTRTKTNTP